MRLNCERNFNGSRSVQYSINHLRCGSVPRTESVISKQCFAASIVFEIRLQEYRKSFLSSSSGSIAGAFAPRNRPDFGSSFGDVTEKFIRLREDPIDHFGHANRTSAL